MVEHSQKILASEKKSHHHHQYFAGIQHGKLHQLSGTTSRITYLILQTYTGIGVSQSQHRKNWGHVLEKMQVNGTGG